MKRVFEENDILHQLRNAKTSEEKEKWLEALRISKLPKIYNEEDMLKAFEAGESNKRSRTISYGMLGSATETTLKQTPGQWLREYQKK